MTTLDLFGNAGTAIYSPDREHRYRLTRRWLPGPRKVTFVMLNPSTATAQTNDPTIRRCIGYAQSWGHDSLEVVNLFALRSRHPDALLEHEDPVGPENDQHILLACGDAEVIVCAWGSHTAVNMHGRGAEVLDMLRSTGHSPRCLKTTKYGHPAHPLYLRKNLRPVPFPI